YYQTLYNWWLEAERTSAIQQAEAVWRPLQALLYNLLQAANLRPTLVHAAMPSIPPRSLTAALFVPAEDDYYQCCLCFMRRKQARGTGYSNLAEH
ncbi:hypothetical protein JG687_00018034, partial [Phytophthora cactorum]